MFDCAITLHGHMFWAVLTWSLLEQPTMSCRVLGGRGRCESGGHCISGGEGPLFKWQATVQVAGGRGPLFKWQATV